MRGIAFLRKIAGESAEEFGGHFDVQKSTVSRWETGSLKLTEEKKRAIVELYGCHADLLDKELSEEEEKQMKNDFYLFQADGINRAKQDYERAFQKLELRFGHLASDMNEDKLKLYEELREILEDPDGQAVVNVLFTATRKYLRIQSKVNTLQSNTVKRSEKDYAKGRIPMGDPLVMSIRDILELANIRTKEGKRYETHCYNQRHQLLSPTEQ